jgi:hypothetical protein
MEELKHALSILKKARAMVRRGWCQGQAIKTLPKGPKQYCVSAALYEAARTYGDLFGRKLQTLFQKGTKNAKELPCAIFTWNDQYNLTRANVLKRFDTIVEDLECELRVKRYQCRGRDNMEGKVYEIFKVLPGGRS